MSNILILVVEFTSQQTGTPTDCGGCFCSEQHTMLASIVKTKKKKKEKVFSIEMTRHQNLPRRYRNDIALIKNDWFHKLFDIPNHDR